MGILVGIDGTGSAFTPGSGRDKEYDVAFAHSFVKRICNAGGPDAMYQRGPVALGGGLLGAIEAGVQHVVRKIGDYKRTLQSPPPVLLTGYSRGGLGAVVVAARLKNLKIGVQALLLFDCVDRHLAFDAEVVPDNVANVYHVIRDPKSSSRESFGNDAMRYYPKSTKYEGPYMFMCTHGGMGGCPWPVEPGQKSTDFINEGFGAGGYDGATTITYEQDGLVSASVWANVQPFIRKFSFMR
ncbi:MAG: hypothetical protein ABI878_07575 [Acidobacteriota bacterium]